MLLLDIIVQWFHLLAAFTWVGGIIFVNVVLTPAVEPKSIPPQFLRLMGMERFRAFAWASIAIVVLTGLYNAAKNVTSPAVLIESEYGLTLLAKIAAVGVMIGITIINSVVLRRRIVHAPAGPGGTPPPEMQTMGGRLVLLSRAILVLGLLVIFLAAMLRYGV